MLFYLEVPPPHGCYIYHGVSGECKYVCDPGQKRAYGLCGGMLYCCYDSTPGNEDVLFCTNNTPRPIETEITHKDNYQDTMKL